MKRIVLDKEIREEACTIMDRLRGETISLRSYKDEIVKEYRRAAYRLASYMENAAKENELLRNTITRIIKESYSDPAIESYDPLQDEFWEEKNELFVRLTDTLTLAMEGGDFADIGRKHHYFQAVKYLDLDAETDDDTYYRMISSIKPSSGGVSCRAEGLINKANLEDMLSLPAETFSSLALLVGINPFVAVDQTQYRAFDEAIIMPRMEKARKLGFSVYRVWLKKDYKEVMERKGFRMVSEGELICNGERRENGLYEKELIEMTAYRSDIFSQCMRLCGNPAYLVKAVLTEEIWKESYIKEKGGLGRKDAEHEMEKRKVFEDNIRLLKEEKLNYPLEPKDARKAKIRNLSYDTGRLTRNIIFFFKDNKTYLINYFGKKKFGDDDWKNMLKCGWLDFGESREKKIRNIGRRADPAYLRLIEYRDGMVTGDFEKIFSFF